jgi:hypothetical protein
MTERNYKVYLIRNRELNDIMYVGLTRQTLYKRFLQHVSTKKISPAKFKMELVAEDLTLNEAVMLEEMYIQQYQTRNVGWNVSPKSINGYSNQHSLEQRLKWSAERKGKRVSPEHAEKNKIARLGCKNSLEHNKKISETHAKKIICLNTGTTYESARRAARALNLSYSKISKVCNNQIPHTKGYRFKFLPINSL